MKSTPIATTVPLGMRVLFRRIVASCAAVAAGAMSGCASPVHVKPEPTPPAATAAPPRLAGTWIVRIHADGLRRMDALRFPAGLCRQLRFNLDGTEAFRQSALAAARRNFAVVAEPEAAELRKSRFGRITIDARIQSARFERELLRSGSESWRGTAHFRPYIDLAADIVAVAPSGRRLAAFAVGSGRAPIGAPGSCSVVEKPVTAAYGAAVAALAQHVGERLDALTLGSADLR